MNQCKATLSFNLADPEQAYEFNGMLKWYGYKRTIEELYEWMRTETKYETKVDVQRTKFIRELRDKLRELRQENGVDGE